MIRISRMSRRQPQLSFLPTLQLNHGGTTRAGKRKIARPIDPKRPIHVTLKSSQARGELSLLHPKNAKRIAAETTRLAIRYGIRLYQYANAGNHLHVLISGKTRRSIQDFMKALSSRISQAVTGARKGNAFGKFWDATFFSRVVNWGRDFTGMRFYVLKNQLEAEGWAEHDRTSLRNKMRHGTHPNAVPVFSASFGRGI
jgi:REP element-mobilizing transposase RayT